MKINNRNLHHLTHLTLNLPNIIKDASHLLDLIDAINKSSLPDRLILVSFDIINMFPIIDNVIGMEAVRYISGNHKNFHFHSIFILIYKVVILNTHF